MFFFSYFSGTVFKLCGSTIIATLTIQKTFLYDAVHKKSSTNPVLVELFEETLWWNCETKSHPYELQFRYGMAILILLSF